MTWAFLVHWMVNVGLIMLGIGGPALAVAVVLAICGADAEAIGMCAAFVAFCSLIIGACMGCTP